MTTGKTLDPSILHQFTGSECWYRFGVNRAHVLTEGAKYVADTAGAYWLMDEISLSQPYNKRVAREAFQVWRLVVRPDHTALLTCDDGDGNMVFKKKITFTDFPLEGITLYFSDNTIFLPSEY